MIYMNLPVLFFLASLVVSSGGTSCVASSEDFAAEVVLPDYNLFNIERIAEQTSYGFVMQSQYNPSLITIIKESSVPNGLSVKLQIPTELMEITNPNIKLVSNSATGTVRDNLPAHFSGWTLSCQEQEPSCIFEKGDLSLSTRTIGGEQELTLEIKRELQQCAESCSGVCFSSTSGQKCLDFRTKKDLDLILKYSDLSDGFEDLLDSYRIVGSEDIILTDIVAKEDLYLNWQEAMRQELVFLRQSDIIDLSREDIENIASLARRGQAGQNYRVVFDFQNSTWDYYSNLESAVLTNKRDCNAYSLEESPVDSVTLPVQNLFYLIPLTIFITGVVLLVVLIIIARTISPKARDAGRAGRENPEKNNSQRTG